MISPFKGKFKLTSPRDVRTDPVTGKGKSFHKGIDLVGLDDKTVYAIADGTVSATPYETNGFGYYIRQILPDGRRIYYGHLASGSIKVKVGDKVNKGQAIAVMGSTGRSTGAHTHLELRPAGTSSDSLDICEFTGIPNKKGVYEYKSGMTAYEAACIVEDVCGLSKETINYLWDYKYAEDLFLKLAEKIKK